jgi:hypothetical protein
MESLFDGRPLKDGFENLNDEVYVLNTSLADYYDNFVADGSQFFFDSFICAYDENAEILSKSNWDEPDPKYVTNGFDAVGMRVMKYTMKANVLFPNLL